MNREILRLAVPSIVSNITVPLLGLVDVAITGHMGNACYMAAIAVGSMMFNVMYWLFSFLRFGTGGLTAQVYGRTDGDRTEMCGVTEVLRRSMLMCIGIALMLMLLQVPLFRLAVWFIVPENDLVHIIRTYYNICIWGTLPSLSLYALAGWFVGMQNTRVPMYVSVLQNVLNILLSCFFVYGLGMKIEGVALGTVIAQWAGMLGAIARLPRKVLGKLLRLLKNIDVRGIEDLMSMKKLCRVYSTLFVRTIFLIAVNLYFIKAGARGGATILAVNSVLMQMFILYPYVMDGFSFAAEALCGRYYGASDYHSFRMALRGVWLWSLVLTAVYTFAYALGGEVFLSLLTNDASVRNAATEYLPWAIVIPLCGVAAFVWDGVFVGITNITGMLLGTFGGAVSFFVVYYLLFRSMGNHALWLAFNLYLLMRGLVQTVVFYAKQRNVISTVM